MNESGFIGFTEYSKVEWDITVAYDGYFKESPSVRERCERDEGKCDGGLETRYRVL